MDVERDGGLGGVGLGVDFFEVGGAEGIVPEGGGGVAGVAGAGAVVAGQEGFALREVLRAWFREWDEERS